MLARWLCQCRSKNTSRKPNEQIFSVLCMYHITCSLQVTEADEVSEDTTTNVTSFKYHHLDEEEEEDCTIADCNDLDDYGGGPSGAMGGCPTSSEVPSFNVTPPSPMQPDLHDMGDPTSETGEATLNNVDDMLSLTSSSSATSTPSSFSSSPEAASPATGGAAVTAAPAAVTAAPISSNLFSRRTKGMIPPQLTFNHQNSSTATTVDDSLKNNGSNKALSNQHSKNANQDTSSKPSSHSHHQHQHHPSPSTLKELSERTPAHTTVVSVLTTHHHTSPSVVYSPKALSPNFDSAPRERSQSVELKACQVRVQPPTPAEETARTPPPPTVAAVVPMPPQPPPVWSNVRLGSPPPLKKQGPSQQQQQPSLLDLAMIGPSIMVTPMSELESEAESPSKLHPNQRQLSNTNFLSPFHALHPSCNSRTTSESNLR